MAETDSEQSENETEHRHEVGDVFEDGTGQWEVHTRAVNVDTDEPRRIIYILMGSNIAGNHWGKTKIATEWELREFFSPVEEDDVVEELESESLRESLRTTTRNPITDQLKESDL